MKKCVVLILCLVLLLAGCGSQQTLETIADDLLQPVMAPMQQLKLTLPENASAMVMEHESMGKLYICDGYTVTVQTMAGGDLDETIRELTGFSRENLTVMQTHQNGVHRTSCVWTAVGEGGDQVGRALILDDGHYHYTVTVMAEAELAGELDSDWQNIFDSAALSTD